MECPLGRSASEAQTVGQNRSQEDPPAKVYKLNWVNADSRGKVLLPGGKLG